MLESARAEIRRSWRETCELNKDHPQAAELFNPDKLPALHDPFAGGGAIPLEAQRLGLEAYASDLNPVAVLINKAMIEIPPKFAGRPPVNPDWQRRQREEKLLDVNGTERQGWRKTCATTARGCARKRKSASAIFTRRSRSRPRWRKDRPDLKPLVGQKLTVIAWLWARTVKSPNPAFSPCGCAACLNFHSVEQGGKEAYVAAGHRGRPLSLHCEDGKAADRGEGWHQDSRRACRRFDA